MFLKKIEGPRMVTLPDGRLLTRADLPPPDCARWVASRKLRVVEAVAAGLLTQEEALARYGLSEEEFAAWQAGAAAHGANGLKITHLQNYRGASGEDAT